MGTTFLVLLLVGEALLFAGTITFSILGLIRWLHTCRGFEGRSKA